MRRIQIVGVFGLAVVVALASFGTASAQVTLDPTWPENPRTFGGPEDDGAEAVQQTSDGGYIVAGGTRSIGAGESDAYVIKLDSRGALDATWETNPKTFGGEGDDYAHSIRQTRPDGGYIVAGWTESFGARECDVYLIKLDAEGNLDPGWEPNPKTFGGEASDWAESVQQTSDGGCIVAGSTWSFGAGESDVYLIKLDSRGNLDPAWAPNPRTVGGEDGEGAHSVQQTSDGGYIVAGETWRGGFFGSDAYVLKLDAAGNLDPAWGPNPKTFGIEDGIEDEASAWSVQETSDGGYIIAGSTYANFRDRAYHYLFKLDSRGDLDPAWDSNPRTPSAPSADRSGAYSVQETADGGYVVAGRIRLFQIFGPSHADAYLLKLDSRGEHDPGWDSSFRTLGGERDEGAYSVQVTADGGYIVAGSTESFGAGSFDVYVAKLAPARHFLRGDCDSDNALNLSDAVFLLNYSFQGGDTPPCLAACDTDGDGTIIGITDAVYLLGSLFQGGAPPPAPFPECGAGQLWTDGPLTCETEPPCP